MSTIHKTQSLPSLRVTPNPKLKKASPDSIEASKSFPPDKGFSTSSIKPVISSSHYRSNFYPIQKTNSVLFGHQHDQKIARQVANILYKYRKQDTKTPCRTSPCSACTNELYQNILPFVESKKPIEMLIICFPFKSPNRQKTLGSSPDKAEELSFKHLKAMITDVEKVYKPEGQAGAKMTIYSDNLVFSTVPLYASDQEAQTYVKELQEMSEKIGTSDRIQIKTIEDVGFLEKAGIPKDIDGRRKWLVDTYGSEYTKEKIKEKMKNSEHYADFTRGLIKFNLEAANGIFLSAAKTALRNQFGGQVVIKIDDKNYVEFIDTETNGTLDNERRKQAIDIVNKAGHIALSAHLGASDKPYVTINKQLRLKETTKGKNEIHELVYKNMQLDQSWVSFINHHTKGDVRFSIHPQPCGSWKTGIELIPGSGWITPWHAVVVDDGNGKYALEKRAKAEDRGDQLVFDSGKPSYFRHLSEEERNKRNWAAQKIQTAWKNILSIRRLKSE